MKKIDSTLHNRVLILLFLSFSVLFNAYYLFPELSSMTPDVNDNAFHFGLILRANEEFENFGNPLDHWVPYWTLGFPLFHHYQHLPHLSIIGIYNVLLRRVPLFTIFHVVLYLLLLVFPLVVYVSMRWLDFSEVTACMGGIIAPVVSGIGSYGFEYESYLWIGWGMFSQLFGMILLPLAVARIYVCVAKRGSHFTAILLLSLTCLTHILFGYIAILSSLLLIVITFDAKEVTTRFLRLAGLLLITAIVISYFVVPLVLDNEFHAKSLYDSAEKFNSTGFQDVCTRFLNGDLFDGGRFPVLTLLCVTGLLVCFHRGSSHHLFIGFCFLLWFFLYFGRPTWGSLLHLLPLSGGIHMQRFINGVHMFGIVLGGIGLGALWEELKFQISWRRRLVAVGLTVLLVAPLYQHRSGYLQRNSHVLEESKMSHAEEWPEFEVILDRLKESEPGRVYVGRLGNWGKEYTIGAVPAYQVLSVNRLPSVGYMPFTWSLPCDFQSNFDEHRLSHYNLFHVRYVVADSQRIWPDFVKPVLNSGPHTLYKVPTTGYFDLVDSDVALYGTKETVWNMMLLWLRSDLVEQKKFVSVFFDKRDREYVDNIIMLDRFTYLRKDRREHVFQSETLFEVEEPRHVFNGQVVFQSDESGRGQPGVILDERVEDDDTYYVRVDVNRECFLLFKMSYHPNWRAYVDDQEKETVILSPGLVGVRIGPGHHQVKCVYRPRKVKTMLLFLGLLSVCGVFLWERSRKRTFRSE